MFKKQAQRILPIASVLFLTVSAPAFCFDTSSVTNKVQSTADGATAQLKQEIAADKQKLRADVAKLKKLTNSNTDKRFNSFMQNHPEFSNYKDKLRNAAHHMNSKVTKPDPDAGFEAAKQKMKSEWSSYF